MFSLEREVRQRVHEFAMSRIEEYTIHELRDGLLQCTNEKNLLKQKLTAIQHLHNLTDIPTLMIPEEQPLLCAQDDREIFSQGATYPTQSDIEQASEAEALVMLRSIPWTLLREVVYTKSAADASIDKAEYAQLMTLMYAKRTHLERVEALDAPLASDTLRLFYQPAVHQSSQNIKALIKELAQVFAHMRKHKKLDVEFIANLSVSHWYARLLNVYVYRPMTIPPNTRFPHNVSLEGKAFTIIRGQHLLPDGTFSQNKQIKHVAPDTSFHMCKMASMFGFTYFNSLDPAYKNAVYSDIQLFILFAMNIDHVSSAEDDLAEFVRDEAGAFSDLKIDAVKAKVNKAATLILQGHTAEQAFIGKDKNVQLMTVNRSTMKEVYDAQTKQIVYQKVSANEKKPIPQNVYNVLSRFIINDKPKYEMRQLLKDTTGAAARISEEESHNVAEVSTALGKLLNFDQNLYHEFKMENAKYGHVRNVKESLAVCTVYAQLLQVALAIALTSSFDKPDCSYIIQHGIQTTHESIVLYKASTQILYGMFWYVLLGKGESAETMQAAWDVEYFTDKSYRCDLFNMYSDYMLSLPDMSDWLKKCKQHERNVSGLEKVCVRWMDGEERFVNDHAKAMGNVHANYVNHLFHFATHTVDQYTALPFFRNVTGYTGTPVSVTVQRDVFGPKEHNTESDIMFYRTPLLYYTESRFIKPVGNKTGTSGFLTRHAQL